MHALKRAGVAIPRAFKNHRSPEGRAYREYVEGILARLAPLPAVALPTLREAGRTAVELERLSADLEQARGRNRRRDAARARREQFKLREQLVRLERRLEELAPKRTVNPLRAVDLAVAEANR